MKTVCFVGTSLVNQCHTGTTVRVANDARSWITWAQKFCGWKFECPIWWDDTVVAGWERSGTPGDTRSFWGYNAGVSGQTTSEILARVPMISKITATEYWVDAGTNDMAGSATAEEVHADRMEICRKLAGLTGKKVRLLTILARGVGSWADPSDARTKYVEVNRLTHLQDEFEVIDFNDGWIDTSADNDVPLSANTNDDIHFNAQGALKVGKKLAEIFKSYPDVSPLLQTPQQSILPVKFFTGVGGSAANGATGTVPDNVKVEVSTGGTTIACSTSSDASVRGDVLTCTLTPSGVAESSRCYIRTNSADTSHSLAGKWVMGIIKVKIDQIAFDAVQLYVEDRGTGGLIAMDGYDAGYGFISELPGGWIEMRTPSLLLVGDSTSIRYRLEVYVNGEASQNGIIDVAEMGVVEVSDPRVKYVNNGFGADNQRNTRRGLTIPIS